MTGMFMYDMTNPLAPVKVNSHIPCDPVVTDGNMHMLALHAGTLRWR